MDFTEVEAAGRHGELIADFSRHWVKRRRGHRMAAFGRTGRAVLPRSDRDRGWAAARARQDGSCSSARSLEITSRAFLECFVDIERVLFQLSTQTTVSLIVSPFLTQMVARPRTTKPKLKT